MRTSDFDYELPRDLIAQTPLQQRDASRLMVLHRADGAIEHRSFGDIADYLRPGDLLVANDSRVIPARLCGHKETGGKVEVLLVSRKAEGLWETLVQPGKGVRPGMRIAFERGLVGDVVERTEAGGRLIRFNGTAEVEAALEAVGAMPLPPYIHERLQDPERYQTVYARVKGSIAAPTAGLHFTPDLIARLEGMGVGFVFVTLHVGLDTFRPVQEEDPAYHPMHSEHCELPPATAALINATKQSGGRVVAVGTTAVRVLETAGQRSQAGGTEPFCDATRLFIRPGHRFRLVDAMITNFHLPRSTLLMLVSAFAGRETILRAYAEAVSNSYRFYSFGDAMLII